MRASLWTLHLVFIRNVLGYHLKPASPALTSGSKAWSSGILNADVEACVEPYYELFSRLADDPEFAKNYFGKAPFLLNEGDAFPGLAGSFTLEDVEKDVEGDFLDAGRGIPDGKGGWTMASVSEPRGPSFEEAKMRYVDVTNAMQLGTVVFNSAGATMPKCGAIALAAQRAFDLPVGLNLYLTAAGTKTSAPPHTDKQDVFVLQTRGAKHWRVFRPSDPSKKAWIDPLARGKADDKLELSELDEPVIDCVLHPGACLYVPAGWPHTTDTVDTSTSSSNNNNAESGSGEPSVHLTLGIDTHVWRLDFGSIRAGALRRANLPDKLVETKLQPPEKYWTHVMGVPNNLGFLRRHVQPTADDKDGGGGGGGGGGDKGQESLLQALGMEIVEAAMALEPTRKWEAAAVKKLKKLMAAASGTADDAAAEKLPPPASEAAACAVALGCLEVAEEVEAHCKRVIQALEGQYLDCANDVRPPATEPGTPPISFFRVKEHMDALEKTMESHIRWYGYGGTSAGKRLVWSEGGKKMTTAGPSGKGAAGAKKSGFGSGGGGGAGALGAQKASTKPKAKSGGKGKSKRK